MKKLLRWLDINFEPLCMTVTFYLMSGLMVLQVILRFAFHTGFAGRRSFAFHLCVAGILVYSLCGKEWSTH